MPRSAIATGLADAVVPLDKIPQELTKICAQIADASSGTAAGSEEEGSGDIQTVIPLLQQKL